MKKLTLLLFSIFLLTTGLSAQEGFMEVNRTYDYLDGKTTFKMHCRGHDTWFAPENDYGHFYETTLYMTSSKKETYIQSVIHKDRLTQISYKQTLGSRSCHYYWNDDKIREYIMKDSYAPNYNGCESVNFQDQNTTDICGILFLLRNGTPVEDIGSRTILCGESIEPISGVSQTNNGDSTTYTICIGHRYHFTTRLRHDPESTPEYIEINIPGFKAKGTLIEFGKRIAFN